MGEFISNSPTAGLNLDNLSSQIKSGELSFALNAVQLNFDGKMLSYQNEQGNVPCGTLPDNSLVIGRKFIPEENFVVFFLIRDGVSEIGKIDLQKCEYSTILSAACMGFDAQFPIHKVEHRKSNCGLEIYWVDGLHRARFIQLENLPFKEIQDPEGGCAMISTTEIDCNKMNLQPNFSVPTISVENATSAGELLAGTYQFAIQYSNAVGEAYTSFYSVTNPASLGDSSAMTQDFNYPVNRALSLNISNIDVSGVFDYINIAVIKTINNIPSVEVVGTFFITGTNMNVIYTGQGKPNLDLTIDNIFQRYELFDRPADITASHNILILADIKTEDRIAYQEIANNISLQWQTKRFRAKDFYKDPINTALYRGYMRDEVYPFSIVFGLDNGHVTDQFPLIGRPSTPFDLEPISNDDVTQVFLDDECNPTHFNQPRHKVYNTASKKGKLHPDNPDDCYEGDWEFGDFSFHESTEVYPCNEAIWGSMANQKIRHFKFPDCIVSPIHDGEFIYPIGVRVDTQQVITAIQNSSLTQEQKDRIKWFKIVRGNRANNASIIAKGLITNVLKYSTENNIIETNPSDVEGMSSIEKSVRDLLEASKDHISRADQGTSIFGTGIRFILAQSKIDDVLASTDIFVQSNIATLQEAIDVLEEVADVLESSSTAFSFNEAAITTLNAAQDIMDAQIQINSSIESSNLVGEVTDANKFNYFPNYLFNDVRRGANNESQDFFIQNTYVDDDAKERFTFHSPDTSFFQPFLGRILKLETVESGFASGHMVQVKNHSKYQFISPAGYTSAIIAGVLIGFASGTFGVSTNVFNGTAAFTAYNAFLDVLYKTIPFKNFAYQWNAIADYSLSKPVPNEANKQRVIDISSYLTSGFMNVGDKHTVNNHQRESAVYLRVNKPLPFTHEAGGFTDVTKLVGDPNNIMTSPTSAYYASMKNDIPNQYGVIGSYEVIDTGYTKNIISLTGNTSEVVFGGDTFINRFAYKSKLPFFTDNRVAFPDGADIAYNEKSNVGRVKYWFSTDVQEKTSLLGSFFATMSHNFFMPQINKLYVNGRFFLFAYGIPYFFTESTVNVDLRQAFNGKEGDFYPRVSSGIPDEWLQEVNVSILNDNTYHYNKTFSKQNKENFFSTLPQDYDFKTCRVDFPFRAVYSEPTFDTTTPSDRNNWRVFKPISRFDFPQKFGKMVSLDAIENGAILVRYENASEIYNSLLTIDTSNPKAAYIGNDKLFSSAPPIDFKLTDYGYNGSQHKFFLRTDNGHISIDSKRMQIHLIRGNQTEELSGLKYKCSKFFSQNLGFFIQKAFPDVNIDNAFTGIGFSGVYDSESSRFIFTKLDYEPIVSGITYSGGKFFKNGVEISLSNPAYFCNKSFTMSFSFITNSWSSFHTYAPNYYVGTGDIFYTGVKENNNLWKHNEIYNKYNHFFGEVHQYILEYPYTYKIEDEIIQSVRDYTKVHKYHSSSQYTVADDIYFNKAIIYNEEQCSGILTLIAKPKNNMGAYLSYPKRKDDTTEILYTKSNNLYNYNTIFDIQLDKNLPVFEPSCKISLDKDLINSNLKYGKDPSFKHFPIRGKNVKVRHILDNTSDFKLITEFHLIESEKTSKR